MLRRDATRRSRATSPGVAITSIGANELSWSTDSKRSTVAGGTVSARPKAASQALSAVFTTGRYVTLG